jgi:hypothetical protein
MSSPVFIVNIEKSDSTKSIGVYPTENEAKKAAASYVEEHKDVQFKRRQSKPEDSRKILFTDKESSTNITLNKVSSSLGKKTTKKPLSPFMIYSKENRQKIIEENPKASFGEIGRILGEEWRKIKELEGKNELQVQPKETKKTTKKETN